MGSKLSLVLCCAAVAALNLAQPAYAQTTQQSRSHAQNQRTQPNEAKPAPTTGAPPVVTQPGESQPIVPPVPVIVQPPAQPVPAGGNADKPGGDQDANQSGTGNLPPLPPAGPPVQPDPSGTRKLEDPDAKS